MRPRASHPKPLPRRVHFAPAPFGDAGPASDRRRPR